jgi:hypothetical protein
LDRRLLSPESTLIRMRPATIEDVPYIFDIRHSERGQWLNATSPDIADQYSYFRSYEMRFNASDEVYFIIFDKKLGRDTGIVRMTRISETENFGWEGLVMEPETTPGCAIDVSATIYSLGFELLGRNECGPWKVLKSNSRVMKMHEVMGVAKKRDEDILNWIVSVEREDFLVGIEKLRKRGFGRIHDEW